MRRAGRTVGRLVVLGGVGVTGLLLVPTPTAARPAEPPPLTLPPVALPPVELPELDRVLAPVTGAVQESPAAVDSLLATPPVPPASPAPAPAPAPAEPTGSSPTAVLTTAPVPAPAPTAEPTAAEPTAGAAPPDDASAPEPPPPPAMPGSEPAAVSRGTIEAVAGAARSFTPLFLLAAAVAGFLVVQGRLDGREAKLATAPVDAEVLEFR